MTGSFTKTPLPRLDYIEPGQIPATFADAPASWLAGEAAKLLGNKDPLYLLVHADDGVIWGRIENGAVVTPTPDSFVPALRSKTVQQCRVFGARGELFIWRESEGTWRGRVILDEMDESADYYVITEDQVLWGNTVQQSYGNNFTLIVQRGQGFRHVFPKSVTEAELPVHLTVCHYLSEDDEGQSRIVYSRLKDLKTGSVS